MYIFGNSVTFAFRKSVLLNYCKTRWNTEFHWFLNRYPIKLKCFASAWILARKKICYVFWCDRWFSWLFWPSPPTWPIPCWYWARQATCQIFLIRRLLRFSRAASGWHGEKEAGKSVWWSSSSRLTSGIVLRPGWCPSTAGRTRRSTAGRSSRRKPYKNRRWNIQDSLLSMNIPTRLAGSLCAFPS